MSEEVSRTLLGQAEQPLTTGVVAGIRDGDTRWRSVMRCQPRGKDLKDLKDLWHDA